MEKEWQKAQNVVQLMLGNVHEISINYSDDEKKMVAILEKEKGRHGDCGYIHRFIDVGVGADCCGVSVGGGRYRWI